MQADVEASGRLLITLTDSATGDVRVVEHHNLVTRYGLEFFAACIAKTEGRTIAQMGIGKSSQPPSSNDAWLMSESARVNCTVSASGAVISINATFGEGVGTSDITELALFGSDTVAFARSVIPVQTKSSTTSMQVQWTITLQAA